MIEISAIIGQSSSNLDSRASLSFWLVNRIDTQTRPQHFWSLKSCSSTLAALQRLLFLAYGIVMKYSYHSWLHFLPGHVRKQRRDVRWSYWRKWRIVTLSSLTWTTSRKILVSFFFWIRFQARHLKSINSPRTSVKHLRTKYIERTLAY